ncbi:hypothetical protein RND81_04G174200 [Saponaria officinalis]|uniref:Uncharacterized protein n=1 Tax=Saponaria officinalis TaxID=3572 RepID=A0AAW1LP31_SAPOF
MGNYFLFGIVLLIPLLLGVLSLFWSTQHQKKRLKNLFTQPQPQLHKSSSNLYIEGRRSRQNRKRNEMEEKREEQKPMRRKISLQNIDAEDTQKQSQLRAATTAPPTSPPLSPLKKSSSTRSNCLCSPTTHVGSFRCRLHRHGPTKPNMRRGHSVGSNLSDLANKFSSSTPPLATSSLQMSASSSQMQ